MSVLQQQGILQDNSNMYINQIQVLKDTINTLQSENTALTAGKTAIEAAYQALLSQLNTISSSSDGGPDAAINVALQPAGQPSHLLLNPTPPPQCDRSAYPKVCFWTEKQFKEWKKTAEGTKKAEENAMVYLENENGEQLCTEQAGKIMSMMREIWHDLHMQGQINGQTTWTTMPLSVKKVFCAELANTYTELTLCEDSWKTNQLAKVNYPSWKQNWFTKKSGNVVPSKRKAAKVETADDADIIQGSEGKRRKTEPADVPDSIDDNEEIKDKSPVDEGPGPSTGGATQRLPSPSPDPAGKFYDHRSCIYR
ncbi:hypothetical protein SCLCIDRAFT_11460 [Scleroderma citrinum Foug A]|uniref:Uncharacterized protein n=1 Tax=Scleroderma citrinum Foug A TaxID=1036808 RepID=A0A0C3DCP7_9AGAM|nr:hypothetical protein SCLCIDRAFT_11460 [Scleroderma citrinum Foug A]